MGMGSDGDASPSMQNRGSVVSMVVLGGLLMSLLVSDLVGVMLVPGTLYSMWYDCGDVAGGSVEAVVPRSAFVCDVVVRMRGGWDATVRGVECARIMHPPASAQDVDVTFNRHLRERSDCLGIVFTKSDLPWLTYDKHARNLRTFLWCWAITAALVALSVALSAGGPPAMKEQ